MLHGNKYITAKNLKIGEKIEGIKDGNMHRMFTAYVKEILPHKVILSMWKPDSKETEEFSTDVQFEVALTEEEFNIKHLEGAKEVLDALKNKLLLEQIGEHEMWNSWLYGSIFEIAAACKENNMKIIGVCEGITPKRSWVSDELLDLGVCCEYEDGDRIWCHFSHKMLDELVEISEYTIKRLEMSEER